MRAIGLSILFGLLLGAAPPQRSPAECGMPYREALAVLHRLPVQERARQESEHGYGNARTFDSAGLTAFGFPLRSLGAAELDAISHRSLTLRASLDAPLAAVRAAALRSRGKSGCTNRDGPAGYCEIDERDADGWTISFVLDAPDGQPVLTCVYTRRAS